MYVFIFVHNFCARLMSILTRRLRSTVATVLHNWLMLDRFAIVQVKLVCFQRIVIDLHYCKELKIHHILTHQYPNHGVKTKYVYNI